MLTRNSERPVIQERKSPVDFMQRCIQLAGLGAGFTAPNPMVGAVLVHEGRIIGEGFHRQYGEAHAEVNCLMSVHPDDRPLIPLATLFVSLEPCCHYGKTPPCTDLILREKIQHVVIGTRDPFAFVDGKGIDKLLEAGVKVDYPLLEDHAIEMNRRFLTFHQLKRPYIVLKWAESANHFIAPHGSERLLISNEWSNRLVHKWRTEEAGIMVGSNTALSDDPELTARLWPGKNPVRIVLDRNLRLPRSLKIFDGKSKTIILNGKKDEQSPGKILKKLIAGQSPVRSILHTLHQLQILSILVEGGCQLLQAFIDDGSWDEIRTVTNEELEISAGISSPKFRDARFIKSDSFGSDTVRYYRNLKI
jgi:diaminohydroxyphosphoribosylaminopyrimidine deaminase / 5-amino-6-(5-phosphoribosylamino)uracil reductase